MATLGLGASASRTVVPALRDRQRTIHRFQHGTDRYPVRGVRQPISPGRPGYRRHQRRSGQSLHHLGQQFARDVVMGGDLPRTDQPIGSGRRQIRQREERIVRFFGECEQTRPPIPTVWIGECGCRNTTRAGSGCQPRNRESFPLSPPRSSLRRRKAPCYTPPHLGEGLSGVATAVSSFRNDPDRGFAPAGNQPKIGFSPRIGGFGERDQLRRGGGWVPGRMVDAWR